MARLIEHSGVVDRVEGDTVRVKITSRSACGACSAPFSAWTDAPVIVQISAAHRQPERILYPVFVMIFVPPVFDSQRAEASCFSACFLE